MCKGGNNNTTTTQSSPNPQAMAAYSNILNRAQGVANLPYTPYGGELTAPMNAQQNLGVSNINANAGVAAPFIQQAGSLLSGAANPLTAAQIQQYQNPYIQNVVNATQAQFANQNAQQLQGVKGNAISQNALGGNREAIAEAETVNQQNLAQNPVIAGLYQQSYQQGLGTAAQQFQQNPQAAAYGLVNTGVTGQNAALTGANAQLGAGTLEQQIQQARDVAQYGQFQQAQAFPYQQTQWEAGLATGVGSNMGGTSATTGPPPNQFAQMAGLGIAGVGALGQSGAFGAGGWMSSMLPLLAVKRGGRVTHGGGLGHHYDIGGGIPGVPYGGVAGVIPTYQITPGRGAPPPPNAPVDTGMADVTKGLGALSSGMKNWPSTGVDAGNQAIIDQTLSGLDSNGINYGDNSAVLTGHGIYRRGGLVRGLADGGSPDIDVNPYGDPIWNQPPPADDFGSRFSGSPADYGAPARGLVYQPPAGARPPVQDLIYRPDTQGGARSTPVVDATDVMLDEDRLGLGKQVSWDNPALRADVPAAGSVAAPDASTAIARAVGAPTGGGGIYPGTALGFTDPNTGRAPRPEDTLDSTYHDLGGGNALTTTGVAPVQYQHPKTDPWGALTTAGLAMMASRSPFFLSAVGEGGLAGMHAYSAQQQQNISEEEKRVALSQQNQRIQLEAQRLQDTARHLQRMDERENSQYLGPTMDGTGSVFLDRKTGQTTVRPIDIGPKADTLARTNMQWQISQARIAAQRDAAAGRTAIGNLKPSGQQIDGGPRDGHLVGYDARHPGTGAYDLNTGEILKGDEKLTASKVGAGGRQSSHEWSYNAWLAAHPGDTQGALDYAGGHRQMGESDIAKSALTMAQRDVNADVTMLGKSQEERATIMRQKAQQYATMLRSGLGAPKAPATAPVEPGAVEPIPARPSSVPAGSMYSRTLKQWRTQDGHFYDASGTMIR